MNTILSFEGQFKSFCTPGLKGHWKSALRRYFTLTGTTRIWRSPLINNVIVDLSSILRLWRLSRCYQAVILPASVTDEKSQVSEKSFDPAVRVVVSGSFLDDPLPSLDGITKKGVFADFEKFKLKKKSIVILLISRQLKKQMWNALFNVNLFDNNLLQVNWLFLTVKHY